MQLSILPIHIFIIKLNSPWKDWPWEQEPAKQDQRYRSTPWRAPMQPMDDISYKIIIGGFSQPYFGEKMQTKSNIIFMVSESLNVLVYSLWIQPLFWINQMFNTVIFPTQTRRYFNIAPSTNQCTPKNTKLCIQDNGLNRTQTKY